MKSYRLIYFIYNEKKYSLFKHYKYSKKNYHFPNAVEIIKFTKKKTIKYIIIITFD